MTDAAPLADLAVAAGTFAYLAAMFVPLERAYPARPGQGFFRPGWGTDLAFFLGQYLVFVAAVTALFYEVTPWLHGLVPPGARRVFNGWPGVAQLAAVVFAGDFLIYWAHRLQHRVDWLWRFHAVHHSAEHLDWLAAHREHPLDTVYSAFALGIPAAAIGLPPGRLGALLAFRGLWAIFVHSNVRAPLGPLGLLVGSPDLHHWHHARDRHGVNFGNVSPLMDLLFGTHYDPGHPPPAVGLREPGPRGYLGLQLAPLGLWRAPRRPPEPPGVPASR